jgi:Domain of unknown function (DUF222)/HNH endonuclease
VDAPSGQVLEQELVSLASAIAASTCRFLLLVAEFDARQLWARWECKSAAHWLSWRCGMSLTAAHEQVRVAHALRALPRVAGRFADGALSYSKVRAIRRVASAQDEDVWLDHAEVMTASQLERVARSWRRVTASQDTARHEERSLVTRWDDDGMLVVSARLPPEEGELLLAALAAVDESSAEDSSTGGDPRPRADHRRADALMTLVRGAAAGAAGQSGPATVVVHVDRDALAGEPGIAHLATGEAIAPASARRLACDPPLTALVRGRGREVLAVGRRRRLVTQAQRRALFVLDEGRCRFPGCEARRFTDIHHVMHWADGGRTDLDNLVTLCSLHHRRLHEGAFTLSVGGERGFTFCAPSGARIAAPPPRAAEALPGSRSCLPQPAPGRLSLDAALAAPASRAA